MTSSRGAGSERVCAMRGIAAGREIRDAVHAMGAAERARPAASRLKATNVRVDARAEEIGFAHLNELTREIDRRIFVLLDDRGDYEAIGSSSRQEIIWVCFDAIDGTKKVAGIGPYDSRRLVAANDGAWASTFAFTSPTRKPFAELMFGDFVASAIVDGNPTRYRTYPQEVITIPDEDGSLVALEVEGASTRRVFTTSIEMMNRCWVFLDSFQAFDRETSCSGDEEIAIELYRLLINRHSDSGAHDVLRQFGSLSALCRTMLGWRDDPVWIESQGGAFIVINENLPNLIPSIAVIAGAGGVSVDFDGKPLRQRRLCDGRTSVIHAANPALRDHCVRVVAEARGI